MKSRVTEKAKTAASGEKTTSTNSKTQGEGNLSAKDIFSSGCKPGLPEGGRKMAIVLEKTKFAAKTGGVRGGGWWWWWWW